VKQLTETLRKELVQRIVRNLLDVQLLRLARNQPMWGYRMKQQAEAKFGVKIRHGALYPLLSTLEKKGYLTSRKQKHGGRIRKVYTITKKGEEYIDTYNEVLREQLDCKDIK
jgi:DNA-binding PadR family transcriptional regulator